MDCNSHVNIDLHIHTTASDGTCSPSEILEIARDSGLGAIAITDHDTIDGTREALRIGPPTPLHLLTGIEISAAPPPATPYTGSMHILGYGINPDNAELDRALQKLQTARRDRNPGIIDRLNQLGFQISLEEVIHTVGQGQISRPHIARVMLKKGYVQSIDEAFDRYLAAGKPAYVDKYRIPCQEAIDLITGAGGLPVLAHPILLGYRNRHELEQLIQLLIGMGLKGLEAYYPEHPPAETEYYIRLAEKHGLLLTGGTDFHGQLNPEIQMGSGNGDFCVPYHLYEQLVASL